ncbi:MAG: glycosyl transferase [Anaerolineaceae bacterium]|nr:glycosyl transferase [Anaerolineaceae bacterium]
MTTNTRSVAMAENRSIHLNLWWVLGGAILLALLAFLLLFRLGDYPAPWYDEGSHLHVAKNLAVNGIYADFSSEGLRYYGPAVGVGPTVMLPIAGLFRLTDVSIPLARLVIVAYAFLAIMTLAALGSRITDIRLGIVAAVLLVLTPGAEFVFNARNVLGEVPGLFFVVAGFWLWFKSGKLSLIRLVGVGTLMGLACITKNQYALIVLPSLLLMWIADLVRYRQRGWRYFVIPGVVAGVIFFAWTYVVLIALGGGEFSENLTTLREASAGAFFLFGVDEMEKAGRFLTDNGVYGAILIPALLYGAFLSLRRTEASQRWGMLTIFMLVSTGLFVSSLAWPRYAFPAVAVGSLFVARLLYDLSNGFQFNIGSLIKREQPPLVTVSMIAAIGLLLTMIVLPVYLHVSAVRGQGSGDVYTFADYLDQNVPQDALIETWEQELAVLTDHNYHYPPQIVLAYSVDETWRDGQPASELYDFRDAVDAAYVVVGPFGKYTELYPEAYLEDYEIVFSQGSYDLYQFAG